MIIMGTGLKTEGARGMADLTNPSFSHFFQYMMIAHAL
jgi:hypothetical protein